MNFKSILPAIIMLVPLTANAITYESSIKQLQAEGIDDPFNTVYLNIDVTISPCSSTNSEDRFAIVNNAQHSAVLAALMANKTITISPSGSCNSGDIEEVNYVIIKP